MQTIAWEASDPDGDPLHYLLQLSLDNARNWITLVTDLTETSYTFDTAQVPASHEALIRVVATDGLRTAQDSSDAAFTVGPKSPQAAIEWPRAGARVVTGALVMFSGYAYDPEDGPLADSALAWESD